MRVNHDAATENLAAQWEQLGDDDPFWAVLSWAGTRHGGWDLGEFDAVGARDVDRLFARLDELGIRVPLGRALDFGCGVGRLTRPLATRFAEVDGVDISASMLATARRMTGASQRVRFHHNIAPDLGLFAAETFDFVVSLMVLQHIPPELQEGYVRELVRVLRPGGVGAVQVPAVFAPPVEQFRMPATAYRADLRLVGPLPPLRAGTTTPVELVVTNRSDAVWELPPADYFGDVRVRVGARWRDARGAWLREDDDRSSLPSAIGPGQAVRALLRLTPPQRGLLTAEIDLVHEHVTWFGDAGSAPLRLVVEVEDPAEPPSHGRSAVKKAPPPIPMIPMPTALVRAAVAAAGGVIVAEMPAERSGDYLDVVYLIRRA